MNISHVAPSPPCTALVAEARVIHVDGRSVRFEVTVVDHTGKVAAAGEHELRVIEVARFRDWPQIGYRCAVVHLPTDPRASGGSPAEPAAGLA